MTCKKLFSGSPIGSYGSKTELLQYYSIKQNAAMIVRRFAFFLHKGDNLRSHMCPKNTEIGPFVFDCMHYSLTAFFLNLYQIFVTFFNPQF